MKGQDIYIRFLSVFGISAEPATVDLLKMACHRWEIGEKELCRCVDEYLPFYFHMEVKGIRLLLRLYVEEWLRMESLWESESVKIYYNVPGAASGMYWLAETFRQAGYKIYAGTPDLVAMVVLYGIIGVMPGIEADQCRHCAVNKMRRKQIEEEKIPVPDIRWSYGLLCDEAPKIDMILEDKEPQTIHVLVQKPAKYDSQKVYLTHQIESGLEKIKNRYHLQYDAEHYKKVKFQRFRLASKIQQIMKTMRKSNVFVIGNEELGLIETLLLVSFQTGQDRVTEILDQILQEIKNAGQRQRNREIRYYFCIYYTPVCNPCYGKIMEDQGIALLYHTAFISDGILRKSDIPAEDMALECMGMLIGKRREEEAEKIGNLIEENQLDGLILGMFSFDRWMGAHQPFLKDKIEEKTGRTVFVYETDFWNQEAFSRERMQTAVETLRYSLDIRSGRFW